MCKAVIPFCRMDFAPKMWKTCGKCGINPVNCAESELVFPLFRHGFAHLSTFCTEFSTFGIKLRGSLKTETKQYFVLLANFRI